MNSEKNVNQAVHSSTFSIVIIHSVGHQNDASLPRHRVHAGGGRSPRLRRRQPLPRDDAAAAAAAAAGADLHRHRHRDHEQDAADLQREEGRVRAGLVHDGGHEAPRHEGEDELQEGGLRDVHGERGGQERQGLRRQGSSCSQAEEPPRKGHPRPIKQLLATENLPERERGRKRATVYILRSGIFLLLVPNTVPVIVRGRRKLPLSSCGCNGA